MTKTVDRLGDVDPRIAASGSQRRVPSDPKSNYEWPGMVRLPDCSGPWRIGTRATGERSAIAADAPPGRDYVSR
jgi:hypothetical protein